MRHLGKLKPLVLGMAALLLTACGTPMAIKNLSSEQLSAQQEFKTALTTLFERMEAVVSKQVKIIEQDIDSTNKERLKAGAELVKKNEQTPQQLTDSYISETKTRADHLARAKENFVKLKSAHRNMLTAYNDMVRAQQTLDEYLRLEKADEKITNSLLVAVGIRRKQVDTTIKAAADALGVAETFSEKVK